MKISVILSAHENSPLYRDTLESVRTYLSKDVAVLVDGFGWRQFESESVDKIEGFRHGKPAAPSRNMALGLMGAWERWGESADWYCYIEQDCLVGSGEMRQHLSMAEERGYWLLGNDLRRPNGSMPELERLCGSSGIKLHSMLGCCLFFSRRFMSELIGRDFFGRFLSHTNFFPAEFGLRPEGAEKILPVHDTSEFIYPSLAVHYGGSVEQLAYWDEYSEKWGGNYLFYPMRFRPDLSGEDPFQNACVMHPIKDVDSPIRSYHRSLRRI